MTEEELRASIGSGNALALAAEIRRLRSELATTTRLITASTAGGLIDRRLMRTQEINNEFKR